MEHIILASGSPRREEYFRLLGLPFSCRPADVDESFDPDGEPQAVAEELALRKIKKVLETLPDEAPPPSSFSSDEQLSGARRVTFTSTTPSPVRAHHLAWICGADTLISLEGKIYGKPADRDDARRMLFSFQGKTHEVISAVALYNGRAQTVDCRSVVSTVTFAPLTPGEIEWYLDSGEWQDAAGAYKIQGLASCLISAINGSYSSIVGLPLREFYAMLRDNGYPYGG